MLDQILAELRNRLRAMEADADANSQAPTPDCLTFERARLLTLDPDRTTANEQAHQKACRYCERLLQTFSREMPHLSLWTLVRRHLGSTDDRERQSIIYHLEDGGCRRCRERDVLLQRALPGVLRATGPMPLFSPPAVAAATTDRPIQGRSPDGRLELELLRDGDRIAFELRTKAAALNHHLVAYSLRCGPRHQEGFMVLRPDVEGWFTAERSFEARDLATALGGPCEELLVFPAVEEALATAERTALLASVEHDRSDARARATWRAWIARMEPLEGAMMSESREILKDVRELLSR